MEQILTFFGNHMILFIILSLVALFALVGFFVDQSEQKKGISKINTPDEEKNMHDLAKSAGNKSLSNAISDTAKKGSTTSQTNTITDMNQESNQGPVQNIGFNTLNK